MMTIASRLGITLTHDHLYQPNQSEGEGTSELKERTKRIEITSLSEEGKHVKTVNLNKLPFLNAWFENDQSAKWDVNMPFTREFPAWTGIEPDSLSVVIFELEPGHKLGEHTDSCEELVLVLSGTVEARLEGEKNRLSPGEMLLIPAMVAHEFLNVGEETARCFGFFASNHITSTFRDKVLPLGTKTLGPSQS
jgi:quercetin dioxygenase-like cupin family protein